jgi:hypothetical protein
MLEHKITKEDGSEIRWSTSRNNNLFCLLYNDDKQKFRFTPTEDLNCELFMIGGGGAGGYFFGGGGGAGAAYINNNYTFKKNKTYTFEVGTGGMCDIADINKLFKSGLNLNIYNNTTINLTNVNFAYDDYSTLGVENSGMMQSFNVNNISIPASIFHKNTTYIWDGYIKTDKTGYYNITINSKLKTMIWVDKFIFNNANALIESNNVNDVKIVQLESNRYYNIKIIAYNENSISNDFSVSFEGCQFFNFDKTEEKYVYIPSSDSVLTYRNDDNTFETIRCKGGGNGGCGFYNKNANLDGGCGGGSGINKIKGTSIIGPIYNGNDGAVGDYCGGGGGIISAGVNNIGGNGKIINWFNETLIFGAGGNAANLNETRNLGYGCGGNGGECCYYSKLLINNNGNNGCILIYVNTSPVSIPSTIAPSSEGFANKDTIMLSDTSIAFKLIKQSFAIPSDTYDATGIITRKDFFEKTMPYNDILTRISGSYSPDNYIYTKTDKHHNQNFIYDMLVISKLYAIIYRLYWYEFNINLKGDNSKWKNFCDNARINFSTTSTTKIDGYDITISNLFDITNLKLGVNFAANTTDQAYNTTLYTTAIGTLPGSPEINSGLINKYNEFNSSDTKTLDRLCTVPIYHNIADFTSFNYLKDFYENEISRNNYDKVEITTGQTAITATVAPIYDSATIATTTAGKYIITFTAAKIDSAILKTSYDGLVTLLANKPDYTDQRTFIYLEALNIILNTDSAIILSTLKFHMHYYNLVVYNASILYGLVKIQNDRYLISDTTATHSVLPTRSCYEYTENTKSYALKPNTGTMEVYLVKDSGTPVTGSPVYIATIDAGKVTDVAIKSGTDTTVYTGAVPNKIIKKNYRAGDTDYYSSEAAIVVTLYNSGEQASNPAHKEGTIKSIGFPSGAVESGTGYTPTTCDTSANNANVKTGPIYTIAAKVVSASLTTSLDNIINDTINITKNITTISDLLKSPNAFTDVANKITTVSTKNSNTSADFYLKQTDLNKTINEYNGELEKFNIISFYYKIILAFSILLFIVIVFIFGSTSIDKNSKISIYIIIVIMILIAIIIYNQYSDVKEGFTTIYKPEAELTSNDFSAAINGFTLKTNITTYKLEMEKYITNLTLSLTNNNIANNITDSLEYIKKLSIVKNEKTELYKIKKMNLMNAIEILKKNSNFYYYIIIFIAFCLIILTIGLILFLISPAMIIQILIICFIPFIILVYYISYNIQKSTRLAENKKYWADYNPSSTTLSDL